MWYGLPTSAAVPLAWVHAEYIKLVRSVTDGRVFDRIDPVHARYASQPRRPPTVEIWSRNRKVPTIAFGQTLRVLDERPFDITWTSNDWRDRHNAAAVGTAVGIWYVDVRVPSDVVRLQFVTSADVTEHAVEIER